MGTENRVIGQNWSAMRPCKPLCEIESINPTFEELAMHATQRGSVNTTPSRGSYPRCCSQQVLATTLLQSYRFCPSSGCRSSGWNLRLIEVVEWRLISNSGAALQWQ